MAASLGAAATVRAGSFREALGPLAEEIKQVVMDDQKQTAIQVGDFSGKGHRNCGPGLCEDLKLALNNGIAGELDGPFRLKDKMKEASAEYDYIFIDTPPTLGMITVNALVASTHVLVPIQSSYFALEGTDDLLETIDKIKARTNPNLQLLGVVITMHDKRTTLARDIHDQIRGVFGDRLFQTVITKSIRLEESPAYKESIFSFAPRSSGAMEYYSLSEEILARV